MKKDTYGDKISKKVQESNMNINSRVRKDLFIKGLTSDEYDKFIAFIKHDTPNKKGYEAINMLLDTYEDNRKNDKLVAYVEVLENKIKDLEDKDETKSVKSIGGKKYGERE